MNAVIEYTRVVRVPVISWRGSHGAGARQPRGIIDGRE